MGFTHGYSDIATFLAGEAVIAQTAQVNINAMADRLIITIF
jgi:hypothetical protein